MSNEDKVCPILPMYSDCTFRRCIREKCQWWWKCREQPTLISEQKAELAAARAEFEAKFGGLYDRSEMPEPEGGRS